MIKYLDKVKVCNGDAYFYTRTKSASTLMEAIDKCSHKDSNGFYRIIIRNRNHSGIAVKDNSVTQLEGFDYSSSNAKKIIIYLDSNKSRILYENCIFNDGIIKMVNTFDYGYIYGDRDIPIFTSARFKDEEYTTGFYNFYDFNKKEIGEYTKQNILESAFVNDSVLGPLVFDGSAEWFIPLEVLEIKEGT